MARAVPIRRKLIFTALAWGLGFVIFFPVLWTVLTSFKTEGEAVSIPPTFLFFDWTTENYAVVQERSDYLKFASNSVILAMGSTLLGLLIAVRAPLLQGICGSRAIAAIATKATQPAALNSSACYRFGGTNGPAAGGGAGPFAFVGLSLRPWPPRSVR